MPAISAIGSQFNMQAYYAANISAARTAAANPSQPNAPVEPVSAVGRVTPDESVRMPVAVQEPALPTVDDLNNASDNLARMRIEYPGEAGGMPGLAQAQNEPQGLEALTAQSGEEPQGLEALTAQSGEEPQGLEALTAQNGEEEAQGIAALQAQPAEQAGAQTQNAVAIGVSPLVTNIAGIV